VRVQGEEDIHVTEEAYRRPIFLLPTYRYHRLPLPVDGAPLEEQFDAFICFLRVSQAKPWGFWGEICFSSSLGLVGRVVTPALR